MSMTEVEFQEMIWGKRSTIKPLPKFERMILVKHGKHITQESPTVIKQRELQLQKIERTRVHGGGGRKAKECTNPFVNHDLNCAAADDILSGVTSSFSEKSSHTGKALLLAVLREILQTMHVISSKDIEHTFGMQERQARRYNQASNIALLHLERTHKVHKIPLLETSYED